MTTGIVVSRRDGVLTSPDGTKHRVARGKTLAHATHPAVLANPGDWIPMVIALTVEGGEGGSVDLTEPAAVELDELREQVAELEETLVQRDAELSRLAEALGAAGIPLPGEDDRRPGWLVDLAIGWIDVDRASVAAMRVSAPAVPPPPKPRKRAVPPPVPQ